MRRAGRSVADLPNPAGRPVSGVPVVWLALLCVLLTSCGSAAVDGASTDLAASSSTSTSASGGVASSSPALDAGGLGPGASSSTPATGRHGGHAAEGAVIIVGGPTVNDNFPEYWGNLYLTTLSQCAVFTTTVTAYPVTVVSVTAPHPVVLVRDCSPEGGKAGHPICRTGLVLPARSPSGCRVGIALPSGTDRSRNYVGNNSWTLSVTCRDALSAPCSSPLVAAHHPSAAAPVVTRWTISRPVRFCGATDYADDHGNPGGTGSSPRNGCSATRATSDSASADTGAGSSTDPSSAGASSADTSSADTSSTDTSTGTASS